MDNQQNRKTMTKGQEDTQRMLQIGLRSLINGEVPVLFKPTDEELRKAGVSEENISRYHGQPNDDEGCGHDLRIPFVILCNQEHFDRLRQVSLPLGAVLYVTSLSLETPSF